MHPTSIRYAVTSRLYLRIRKTLFALVAGIVAGLAVAAPIEVPGTNAQAGDNVRHWHFAVLLDGKPIGQHEFVVTGHAGGTDVHSTAHFKVKALLVPLYHYQHEDQETWKAGCLVKIDARTNDNGKLLELHGQVNAGKFTTGATQSRFAPCVHTFAYWDRDLLSDSQLLNSETGEYTPVQLHDRGREQIRLGQSIQDSEHYALQTARFIIDLWYSADGRWLALQTLTTGGHTLRYEAT